MVEVASVEPKAVDPVALQGVSVAALVERAVELQRLVNRSLVTHLQVLAELARRDDLSELELASAVTEIGVDSGIGEYQAWARLAAGRELFSRLPVTAAAAVAGDLEWRRIRTVTEATEGLSEAVAAAVDAKVGPRVAGLAPSRLRAALARAEAEADPGRVRERAAEARRERRVSFDPAPDSMAQLWALLPVEDVAAIRAAVEAAGPTASPTDPRTADQRRADTLVTLLTGAPASCAPASCAPASCAPASCAPAGRSRAETPTGEVAGSGEAPSGDACRGCGPRSPGGARGAGSLRPQLLITVPVSTLAGLDDTCPELAGYGLLPAELVRDLATRATWRCAATDEHGTILGLGTTTYTPRYTPGAGLRRLIETRDRTCVFPGCARPAGACDLDHRVPHPRGATCECNLAALCRRHHRLKTHTAWTVARSPEGALTWTTPHGRTHRRALDRVPLPAPVPLAEPPPL